MQNDIGHERDIYKILKEAEKKGNLSKVTYEEV